MIEARRVSSNRSADGGLSMADLVVSLSDETRSRLEALALRLELTPAESVQQAIAEFVENWEDHLRVVAALQEDELRPVLSTASTVGE
jgi:predicted DNA-binding protein